MARLILSSLAVTLRFRVTTEVVASLKEEVNQPILGPENNTQRVTALPR